MALARSKKPCSKCDKGMGILTCDGCEQSFCAKHITDHREELSSQMDNIGQEYDLLRRDLIRDDTEPDPLFNRIDSWEQESITKIQKIAQQARNDLQQYFDRNKNQIENILNKLADELQSSRQSGDYTEIDFKLWIKQLTELQKTLEKTPSVDVVDDDKTLTPIYMIKITEKTNVHLSHVSTQPLDHHILTTRQPNVPVTEIYNHFIGSATFSGNSLVATHFRRSSRSTMVYITEPYSSGIHQIHFRIEQKNSKYLFFGIVNSLEQMTRTVLNSPSIYGWMAPDVRIVKSRALLSANFNVKFNEDDEVLLTLNCDNQQILLEHQQTDTIDQLPIDLRICPIPWRVIVALFSRNDSVRIIH